MTVAEVADAVWAYQVSREPYLQMRNGLPVEHLRTGSLAEAEEAAAFARTQLGTLSSAGDSADLTAAYLRFLLQDMADGPDMWWSAFSVTPYGIYQLNVFASQAVASYDLTNPADVGRLRAIAADYAAAVRIAHDKLRMQTERGWALPLAALPGAVSTMQGMRANAPKLFGAADSVVDKDILPALDAVLDTLASYGPHAMPGVGLAQYPGGPEAYERLLRAHVTYEITAAEIHQLGLAQIEELTEQLAGVRSDLGFHGTEDEFRRKLEAEGHMHATDASDVEQRYRRAIARIEPALSSVFAVLPEARYDIARLDPSMEAGLTYGYYEPPTDSMPVGRYRYNGSGLDTRSQLNAAAIIYHELIPGHHFHVARQKENATLPSIRRENIAFTAFTEGWAEYAAGLANELGCYEDPYDKYGWLIHQRFVAQRLVIDTGMNALGWPLDRAQKYMSEMTFESDEQVRTDTLRYSTDLPGQALGYRLGHLKLLELRERYGRSAKEFHELVLGEGALPLSVLEDHVRRSAAL